MKFQTLFTYTLALTLTAPSIILASQSTKSFHIIDDAIAPEADSDNTYLQLDPEVQATRAKFIQHPNYIMKENGLTPLMYAACNDNMLFAKFMLKTALADVNARGEKGRTALMCAAEAGNLPMIQYLLINKADRTLVDSDGKKACDYVQEEAKFLLDLLKPDTQPIPVDSIDLNMAAQSHDPILIP